MARGVLVMSDLPKVYGSNDISRNFPRVAINTSNCFYFQQMSMLSLLLEERVRVLLFKKDARGERRMSKCSAIL